MGDRVIRIGMVSAAYWGDVLPFAPLARALGQRGHDVRLAVPRGFHDVLAATGRSPGVTLTHLGTDFSPAELADHATVLDRSGTPRGMRAASDLWIRRMVLDRLPQVLPVLEAIQPDVWVVHPSLAWLVDLVRQERATPMAVLQLFPMLVPTAEHPPPGLPGLPAMANRVAWSVMRHTSGIVMHDRRINATRTARGLPPRRANVAFGWQDADAVLLPTSPLVWPRASDWPERIRHTGLLVWGQDADLPEDVAAHLDAGAAPVLVTLGTSAGSRRDAVVRTVLDVLDARGDRAVVLLGEEGASRLLDRPDTWRFVPLPAVLPRCRLIVNAGGYGGTAAALTAGAPQVVLPLTMDQRSLADRCADLGVAVVLSERPGPEAIRRAIDRAVSLSERARELADALSAEDGPAAAADVVEGLST